ncbi:MAG: hypothetical protein EAZ14_12790, partial [Runella slithyformis]
MSSIYHRTYALVSAGELLGDLIGTEFTQNLTDTEYFRRFQGGSPANLAANMARLGHKTALVACVGRDNLGHYLVEKVAVLVLHEGIAGVVPAVFHIIGLPCVAQIFAARGADDGEFA